jgi:hypothetical protein
VKPPVFVFLGPSLPVADARRILDAVYLPPVSMGDIYRLMARRPTVIAIIDGLFEQTPAVWHKEILYALSRGVRVLGASSMGALRAAELAAFGMEGVGEVFEAFHRGELEDDDEVAVAHASAGDGYRSLSDAMVNLRAGLRQARQGGQIGAGVHDRLLAAAKSLHYPDRSWPRLFELADAAALEIPAAELAALRALVARGRPDVKRADAIRLLRQLAEEENAGDDAGGDDHSGGNGDGPSVKTAAAAPARAAMARPAPSFDFEPTYFWEQMILHEGTVDGGQEAPGDVDGAGQVGDAGQPGDAGQGDDAGQAGDVGAAPAGARPGGDAEPVSAAALRRHVRLHAARARAPLDAALLLYLADEQAARRGLELGATDLPPASASPDDQALPPLARRELGRGQAAVAALLRATPDQINRKLSAALAHLGRLEPTLAEIRRKQARLSALGLRAAAPADAGATIDELLVWYEGQFGALTGSPEAHALEAGFTSLEEFVSELTIEFMVAKNG